MPGLLFRKCSHWPKVLVIGPAVWLTLVKHIHLTTARFGAALVAFALLAAACGTEATSTAAIDPGSGVATVDESPPSPTQADGGDAGAAPASAPSSDGAVATTPPQTPSAETSNDVVVGNYPSFEGSTSDGASFEMASLAGEDASMGLCCPSGFATILS